MSKNDKGGLSRRDLLFGAVKRLRLDHLKDDEAWEEEEPKAQTNRGVEAAVCFVEGNEAFVEEDFASAADSYRDCLKIERNHLEARRRLGLSLYKLGKYTQARVEFEQVLYGNKKDNFSSLFLGLSLMRSGKTEKAVEAWKNYFNPDEIAIQREINLQLALLETDQPPTPEEAADAVERVVDERRTELLTAG